MKMLTKTLIKIGNTQGIILDKPITKLIGAEVGTTFKVTVKGDKVILERLKPEQRRKMVMDAAREVIKKQSKVLKKLAQ
jgi:antitoxin component of MazEF toxin-antitoxin module